MNITVESILWTYVPIGIVAIIGIACTYWSQYKHRKHHRS